MVIPWVLVAIGSAFWMHSRVDRDMREHVLRNADQNERLGERSVAALDKQAAESEQEAQRLQREAAQLTLARANDEPTPHQMTRSEAIEADPFIIAVLDEFPQLRVYIESGDASAATGVLILQGKLRASDANRINRFAQQMNYLPKH